MNTHTMTHNKPRAIEQSSKRARKREIVRAQKLERSKRKRDREEDIEILGVLVRMDCTVCVYMCTHCTVLHIVYCVCM